MTNPTPWYWKKVSLFDQVGEDGRRTFFKAAEQREYRKGEYIFLANDSGSHVFFLRDGKIKVYHLSLNGEASVFWYCVPGDLFGAGGISGSTFQSVFAQASEPSIVCAIPRASFENALIAYPRIGLNVIRFLSGRLRLACDAMADLSSAETNLRLARVLLRLAESCGQWTSDGTIELAITITHQEIANMVGSCRQTTNEILREFCSNGWIEMRNRRITILDVEALHGLAAESVPVAEAGRTDYSPSNIVRMNKKRLVA